MVGSLLTERAQPLPADLQGFLDQATAANEGAVYVSFGTWANPTDDNLLSIARGLNALDKHVLWKLDLGT